MKNTSRSKFINLWPTNPTQNMFSRAVKIPQTGLDSEFSKFQRGWKKKMTVRNKFSGEYKND